MLVDVKARKKNVISLPNTHAIEYKTSTSFNERSFICCHKTPVLTQTQLFSYTMQENLQTLVIKSTRDEKIKRNVYQLTTKQFIQKNDSKQQINLITCKAPLSNFIAYKRTNNIFQRIKRFI